ncbi:amino acid adenylation domain-containing protein [Nostoc sp. CCCryo 231-06]|nr:amino acid adenylation domain-containing protein [Nostoc sp. CCCryo 231-06]
MNLSELLTELCLANVKLWVDDHDSNQLRIRAPKGVITPELQKLLSEQKAEILLLLRENSAGVKTANLPYINPCSEQRYAPFPLTDIQHAFWIGRSGILELGNVANHGYYEIESNNLDLEGLSWSLQQLIERHDMLRAIVLPDGQQQILEKVPPYQIEILDLRGQEEKAVVAQIEAIRQRMSHQVLPTDKWPLFEFRVTRLDEERFRLHVSYDLQIFDAWSLFRLFDEWYQLYQNPQKQLTPLELTFRDYVLAEQALQDTELYKRSQQYWFNRLDTLPPPPDLPLAKNPKELKQHRCQRYEGRLEQTEWQKLKQRAADAGLTPSGVLLAAFAEILTVWSHNTQFTINLALFNRLPLHDQVNDILGDFTSITLLAVDNSTSEAFSDRAVRLQQQLWQDLEHRYISGVRVVRELARRKGIVPSAMPVVFTSTIGFSSLGQETSTFSHFGELVYGISQASQAWMDVQVWEEKGELTFNWDVVAELFPEGLIKDMFAAYCRFLQQLATSTSVWLETNRQMVPFNQLALRDAVNSTAAPIPDEMLHTLFAKQVQIRKNECAVVSSQRSLTYQELSELSNQVGHRLRDLGTRPNQLVAVVMEKGWEQIVAVLGILAAGAAYVPIDPGLPQERRQYLLENSQASIVLTQSWLNEKLAWSEEVIRLCIDNAELADESILPLEPVQTSADLAYLIYTSGSTGFPKGVKINHCGAVNTIGDINQRFGVNSGDRILALSSLSFDLSVYDVFGTLAAGGTIIIPDASSDREPAHWVELIVQHHVTVWNSVPALMQMLVDYASDRPQVLANLRLILLSGDWLPLTLPDQIKDLIPNPDIQVISLGGATEASIWSILYPIQAVDPAWKSIPYGQPMANQRFYILNKLLEPSPVWVSGELFIGGIGLAEGYWGDESKTTASFITHPLNNERLYRTGDLGRYLPDGNIEFLGREDCQIKIGGYRIELGEIEAVLMQHSAVRQGVVTVVGEVKSKRLVAYVVPHQEISTDALHCFLQDKLPEYMLPSAFLFLDTLPLSANGKVDRRALPNPEGLLPDLKIAYVAPKNNIEQTIASVWQVVLKVEKVGVLHKFFELGGNSLLLIEIYGKLKKELPEETLSLSIADLFNYSTIRALSDHLNGNPKIAFLKDKMTDSDLNKELNDGKNRLKQRYEKSVKT